jgi:undecaprenyl diphosphate synthase
MGEQKNIPQHVAIVMDGNGRWAKKRFMPRAVGHRAGAEIVQSIVEASKKKEIKVLTLFAFSSENWLRPIEEVNELMGLFLTHLEKRLAELNQANIRLRFIGDLIALNDDLRQRFQEAQLLTKNNDSMNLVVAVNYGGQWDILQACKKVYDDLNSGQLKSSQLTPDFFSRYLSTEELPPVDLFIRTSGESRISNFLLWQLAYSELYFTDVLWPDFNPDQLQQALDEYAQRRRRFGKTDDQLKEKLC